MKIFQIVKGWCHHDCTKQFPSVASTVGKFTADLLFVEAPDYVFEGWAFDETKKGDNRFIRPEAPEGWLYDEATGTLYMEGSAAPGAEPSAQDDTDAMMVDHEYRLTMLELGLTE